MRVPKNKIKTGKYTSGNEFVEVSTNKSYQGYYYELNNRFYIGKEFDANAAEIIRVQQQNQLYNVSQGVALFSFISKVSSQALSSPRVPSLPPQQSAIRYFSQQVNIKPITIKEINKETYEALQGNALYKTTLIGPEQSIDQAEKQMPGLKAFLSV